MPWFATSKFLTSVQIDDKLHEARHALSALLRHVEGKSTLSSLEIDQYKQQIQQAIELVC